MNPKKRKLFIFGIVAVALFAVISCVAKSGYELRFRDSAAMNHPSFDVAGVDDGMFSFLFVGDVHLAGTDTTRLRTILQAAKDNGDAFVIFLGDMVDKGAKGDFETFKAVVNEFGFQDKAIYVVGNHDVFEDGWSAYRELMGPSHYSITLGNCRFLIIDSADGIVGEQQSQWLEERLKEEEQVKHTFLLSHYMPVIPGERTYLRLSNETEAAHVMKLMTRFGVRAWLGGHYHSFAQQEIERVNYIVAGGGGGRRMEPVKDLFYVRASVNNDQVSYRLNRF